MRFGLLVTVMQLALPACGGDGSPAPRPCAPLAGAARPIALGTVLGAGRHADGTIYVADREGAELRAFVTEAGALRRRRVAGTGELGAMTYLVSVHDEPAFTLKIVGGASPRMGVIRGHFTGRDFEIGQQGDVLEVLDASALSGLPIVNLPGEAVVEYAFALPDGRHLVVLRPLDDWSYDDFRLFLGAPERLTEREVSSVMRARDGGTTDIDFVIDGRVARAHFPAPRPDAPAATLTDAGDTVTLTAIDAATASADTYYCR